MGDVQQFFVDNDVRNFYSVSISGYHIAEAGRTRSASSPSRSRTASRSSSTTSRAGWRSTDFAPNLSFFFSNGMDPEYGDRPGRPPDLGARDARALRREPAQPDAQVPHPDLGPQPARPGDPVQRHPHHAAGALPIFDNCNSLHTNAYDEAITTPTEESVRRAVAIQLIINRELGLNMCENPWQGSFVVDELTDLVEQAVYSEFHRLSERGGVLGAMDTMYQRSKIQEESLYYESLKHSGALPIIGVKPFLPRESAQGRPRRSSSHARRPRRRRARSSPCREFQERTAAGRPAALPPAGRRPGPRERLRGAHGGGQVRLARADLGRPLPGRRRVPAQRVGEHDVPGRRRGRASTRRPGRPDRLPRPEHHRAALRARLEGSLVGRTGFCVHPRDVVRGIRKVGGTKDVKLDVVRELEPTHVVVNVDENRRETAEELASFVPNVIVTHPLGPTTTRRCTASSAASSAARRRRSGSATLRGGPPEPSRPRPRGRAAACST